MSTVASRVGSVRCAALIDTLNRLSDADYAVIRRELAKAYDGDEDAIGWLVEHYGLTPDECDYLHERIAAGWQAY